MAKQSAPPTPTVIQKPTTDEPQVALRTIIETLEKMPDEATRLRILETARVFFNIEKRR